MTNLSLMLSNPCKCDSHTLTTQVTSCRIYHQRRHWMGRDLFIEMLQVTCRIFDKPPQNCLIQTMLTSTAKNRACAFYFTTNRTAVKRRLRPSRRVRHVCFTWARSCVFRWSCAPVWGTALETAWSLWCSRTDAPLGRSPRVQLKTEATSETKMCTTVWKRRKKFIIHDQQGSKLEKDVKKKAPPS